MDNNISEIPCNDNASAPESGCKGSYGDIVIGETTVMKKLNDYGCFPCFIRESSALTLLRKAGVGNVVNVQSIDEHATITMDKWHGNLIDALPLTNEQIYRVTYDILVVMCNMLHLHIAHRDIKPENILVDEGKAKIAVCDFGLSRYYSEGTRPEQSTQTVQTSMYRSPELIYPSGDPADHGYNPANLDIWSLGISVLQLMGLDNMLPPPITAPASSPAQDGINIEPDLGADADSEAEADYYDPEEYIDLADAPLIYQHLYGNDTFDEELVGETDIDPCFLAIVKRMLTVDYKDRPLPDDLVSDPFFDRYRDQATGTGIVDAVEFNKRRVAECLADLSDATATNQDHLTSITNYEYINSDTVYLATMLYYRLLKSKVPTDDDVLNIIWLALLTYDTEVVHLAPSEVAELLVHLDYDLYLPIGDPSVHGRLDELLTMV